MLKRLISDELTEAMLLFAAFYLPGYLFQGGDFSREVLYDSGYTLTYLVSVIPQILLVLYLIQRKNRHSLYGLQPIRIFDAISGLLVLLAILCIAFLMSFFQTPVNSEPTRVSVSELLLIALSAIVTGYREELFFRSMLFRAILTHQESAILSGFLVSFLFAAGHIYQGALALAGTFAMALLLQWHFIRYKNVHVVAIVHGVYNFLILLGGAYLV